MSDEQDNPASLAPNPDNHEPRVRMTDEGDAQIASMNQHAAPQDSVDGGDYIMVGDQQYTWEDVALLAQENRALKALAAIPSLSFDEAAEIGTNELLKHKYSEMQTDRELIKFAIRALTACGDVLIRSE
jgi:hypothetical protein